jgi:hypothetical protein
MSSNNDNIDLASDTQAHKYNATSNHNNTVKIDLYRALTLNKLALNRGFWYKLG